MKLPLKWLKDYLETDLSASEIADRLTLVGHALDKPIYESAGDLVLDLEDRGNRADTVGIIGLARDLAALLRKKLEYPPLSALPEVNNEAFRPKITVTSDKVLRFTAVVLRGVKVGPSPEKIQQRLKAYGVEVINNVVDVTNYVMIETGMPLHAFDVDKIDELILRPARKGERLVTFEGTNLELDENDLVAADSQKPLTLTTAIGGRESGVTEKTVNVLIEAGLYHQPTARRSALKHHIRNETANRLGKYLHPHFCPVAIGRTIKLLAEILAVSPERYAFDYCEAKPAVTEINLTQTRLETIAGAPLNMSEAAEILKSLEFNVVSETDSELAVEVPYFRTDVTMEDDLIEEVLRIKGYDNLPSFLPQKPSPPKLNFPEMDLENRIRDILVKIGYSEVRSQEIVDVKDVAKIGLLNESQLVRLQNSWNAELNVLRPEFISPQLKYVLAYQKQSVTPIKIFEVGKTYLQEPGKGYDKYKEIRKVAVTADADFFDLKSVLLRLLKELGIEAKEISFEKIDFPAFKKSVGAKIIIGGQGAGKIGNLKSSILEAFGIAGSISHFVLHVTKLLKFAKKEMFPKVETAWPHYISEDFTFVIGEKEEIGKISERLAREISAQDRLVFTGLYLDEELKAKGKKSATFNIKFAAADPEKAKLTADKVRAISFP